MSTVLEETVVTAPDISCAHCAAAITQAVGAIPGVQSVDVDIASKRVTIGHQPGKVALAEIARVMDDEGYPISQ
ncbi:MAG: heavy-metal-associated domain-containing protein [Thermomicrobiales bacterium]